MCNTTLVKIDRHYINPAHITFATITRKGAVTINMVDAATLTFLVDDPGNLIARELLESLSEPSPAELDSDEEILQAAHELLTGLNQINQPTNNPTI